MQTAAEAIRADCLGYHMVRGIALKTGGSLRRSGKCVSHEIILTIYSEDVLFAMCVFRLFSYAIEISTDLKIRLLCFTSYVPYQPGATPESCCGLSGRQAWI